MPSEGCCSSCARCCNNCCVCCVDEETKTRNHKRNWERAFIVLFWLSSLVGCVWYVASYYGIIILNFTFFYVTFVMYVIVPVRAVMSRNFWRVASGVIQIVCYAPYIQFFLYFLVCSVQLMADLIPDFIEMFLTGKFFRVIHQCCCGNCEGNKPEKRDASTQEQKQEGDGCLICCCRACIEGVFVYVWVMLVAAIGVIVFLGVFARDGAPVRQYFMCIVGCLVYAPFVFEIFFILVCVYENWFLTISCRKKCDRRCSQWARKAIKAIKGWDTQAKKIQQGNLSEEIKQAEEAADREEVTAGNTSNHSTEESDDSSTSSSPLETVENTEKTGSDEPALSTDDKKENDSDDDADIHLSSKADKEAKRKAEKQKLKSMFCAMLFPGKYTHISDLSDELYELYREKWQRRIWVWVVMALNLFLIGYDIFDCQRVYNRYFCACIVFRIMFFPAACYFHQGIAVMKPKRWREAAGSGLRRVIYFIGVFSIVLLVACIAGAIYVAEFMEVSSVADARLTWPTGNIPDINFTHGDIYPALCSKNYYGTNIVDIVGTSFGVYEKFRDPTLFSIINEHLYPGWDYNTSTEGIELDVLGEAVPMVLFHFDNLTVWAFRGFASGPELATVVELFCSQYVIPFFQSFIVFKDYIESWFLDLAIPHAYALGVFCFTSETVLDVMVDQALMAYHNHSFSETDNVVFAGINTGGVVAKILGMKTGRLGFSVLSFNAFTDLLQYMDLDEDESWRIVNLFHRGGWFSVQEQNLANNIILPSVIDNIFKDDKRPTFCTMALACENHLQYEEFCRQMMGDEFVDKVHNYLKDLSSADIYGI